jgi:hypothetical protein
VILMLLALILRGCAFEFRLRGRHRGKRFWTIMFATARSPRPSRRGSSSAVSSRAWRSMLAASSPAGPSTG